MSWFTGSSIKPLEKLLLNYPSIQQLLSEPDFINQLKAFNSKLLDYISNHSQLIKQAVDLIIIPPKESDSADRKYKYPLLAIQMIETEATCIINGLFKQISNGKLYLDHLFQIVDQKNILLISAGYFFRVNHCLLNVKTKQIIQFIYSRSQLLKKLLQHTSNSSISLTLQLFINLDASKVDKQSEQKKNLKIQLIWNIMAKIDQEKFNDQKETIQNLSVILIEIVEKYYLILDGKAILDPILTSKSIGLFLELASNPSPLISIPILNLLITIINYYSFSSYNSEDKSNQEFTKKNFQRLELQPLVQGICLYFQKLLKPITNAQKITFYHYKILEFLCHTVSLCSNSIFNAIKRTNFLQILLQFLFKFENNNILHTLIERTFLCIFANQKKFYQIYRQYIFCQINIIQKTVLRVVNQKFDSLKKKGYFGYLMRIIKIYSSIQTTNDSIINKIRQNSEIWSRITKQIIKPYQEICFKDLGSYQINIVTPPIQYKIKQSANISIIPKNDLLQKYSDEQYSQFLKPHHASFESPHDSMTKPENDKLFKIPIQQISIVQKVIHSQDKSMRKKSSEITEKKQNYNEFLTKKKSEAEQKLKLQKSLSQQKRGASPALKNISPKKYNIWEKKQDDKDSMRQRQKSPVPLKKTISQSVIVPNSKLSTQKEEMIKNTQQIQKLKVKIIDTIPVENRKYRKIDEKDKILLNFLGIYR